MKDTKEFNYRELKDNPEDSKDAAQVEMQRIAIEEKISERELFKKTEQSIKILETIKWKYNILIAVSCGLTVIMVVTAIALNVLHDQKMKDEGIYALGQQIRNTYINTINTLTNTTCTETLPITYTNSEGDLSYKYPCDLLDQADSSALSTLCINLLMQMCNLEKIIASDTLNNAAWGVGSFALMPLFFCMLFCCATRKVALSAYDPVVAKTVKQLKIPLEKNHTEEYLLDQLKEKGNPHFTFLMGVFGPPKENQKSVLQGPAFAENELFSKDVVNLISDFAFS